MPIFFLVLMIVGYILQKWSLKNALKGVDYTYGFNKQLVEPEEEVERISVITNHSSRFVSFMELEEKFPENVIFLQENVKPKIDYLKNTTLTTTTYLMPKSCLERRISLTFAQRGVYLFYGASLTGGDFLGVSMKRKTFTVLKEVIVYPKIAHLKGVDQILKGFLGDVSVKRFMMEDPILTTGAREYTGREPLKQISWKQSARLNRLMVKQYDYSSEPVVSVLLDINMEEIEGYEIKTRLLEHCFSLTRTICQLLVQKGIAYDFISNASTSLLNQHQLYLAKGLGRPHFRATLEILGKSTYISAESFFETVESLAKKHNYNLSTLIIMPRRDNEKQQGVKSLVDDGSTLTFIYGEEFDDIISDSETN